MYLLETRQLRGVPFDKRQPGGVEVIGVEEFDRESMRREIRTDHFDGGELDRQTTASCERTQPSRLDAVSELLR